MPSVPVARAHHLLPFLGVLRGIGAPVDRELARAKLPACVEEAPDAYINLHFAYDFLATCAAREGIDDLGFEAGWMLELDDLGPDLLRSLDAAPTTKARLAALVRLFGQEASTLSCKLVAQGSSIRVCVMEDFPADVDPRFSEWQSLKAVIEVVRSAVGPEWQPSEICLTSAQKVHPSVLDRLDGIDVRTGQLLCSFLMSVTDFARPARQRRWANPRQPQSPGMCEHALEDFVEVLRAAMAPYLLSGYPSIGMAADIAGMSTRTLQRVLRANRTSYSELIENLRFDLATQLLADSDMKVIDIALQLGYEHSQNFSRAFHRVSGLTPQQYRQAQLSC